MQYDVVIVGAGIAGLYAAMQLPTSKKVLIINKAHPWECNTFYAQGGVTTAVDRDDIPSHIADTLNAGAGLCNEDAVRVLSEGSLGVIEDLIARGFKFDSADLQTQATDQAPKPPRHQLERADAEAPIDDSRGATALPGPG